MPKIPNKYLLLFTILALSFTYRMLLMYWGAFPPGADIGLHNSLIHSITLSGNTNFLWNFYQMGGGISLTFPGYHIFVSYIILITGLPEIVAHSLVASLFSSLIAFCAFLITKTMWNESAGFVVAFLVAISRFDIEMLFWGGYPNVITLMLMPLVFYLYLRREKFSLAPFLVTTTILSGAIFLTHSLSAFIFVVITVVTVLVAAAFPRSAHTTRKSIVMCLSPLFLGALVVSPFLIQAVPAYLQASAETFTGSVSGIRLALIATRILPLDLVLPLLICVPFFLLFSKEYKKHFFTVTSLLLVVWILIPVILTQGFLVGFYIDYNRFLYFTILPVLILIAVGIDHVSRFFSRLISTYVTAIKTAQAPESVKTFTSRVVPHVTSKNVYSIFTLGLLLFSFFFVPLFLTPSKGITVQSFYQVMNDPGYEATQWVRQNTPVGSVFVSDALYGWWLSGFAQRPTLSAVEPQYLTVSREFEPAKVATSLLDTDYLIDNGLMQVREDGGFIGRHNPMFLAKLFNVYNPYPLFHFNSSEITVFLRKGSEVQSFDLTQVPVKSMGIQNNSDYASISVNRANQLFSYTETTTMYRGVRFVNMSITVESNSPDVTIDWIRFVLHTKGKAIRTENSVAVLDEGTRVLGQVIFAQEQPKVYQITSENPSGLEMFYNLDGKPKTDIKLFVGVYQVKETTSSYIDPIIADNLNSSQEKVGDLPLDVFDYQKALVTNGISYIACRDHDVTQKFAADPSFSLVFINDRVAIFMVKSDFNQLGRQPSS